MAAAIINRVIKILFADMFFGIAFIILFQGFSSRGNLANVFLLFQKSFFERDFFPDVAKFFFDFDIDDDAGGWMVFKVIPFSGNGLT